jgi:23S rRNA pseudouridine1911/1915/1917 synthase
MNRPPVRLDVPEDAAGARLDAFLAAHEKRLTRSAWKRAIEDGRVTVEGRVVAKPSWPLKPGATVEASLPDPAPSALHGEAIPLTIVHEDEDLVVVDKPAGLVVHPGHGNRSGTLVQALLGRGTPLAPSGGEQRPGIVHRLDKNTSGLIVVAKSNRAHRALAAAFAGREVSKTYVALVAGTVRPAAGRIEAAIGRSRRDPTKMAVRTPRARSATTIYRTLETLTGATLLEVDLVTGRTHQIRVHLASKGNAVVGDDRYGSAGRRIGSAFGRLALHAAQLSFRHPVSNEVLRFTSPLPDEFEALLARLRKGTT